MLHLNQTRAPREVNLTHGVTLVMRQPGQFEFDLATNAGKAAARKLSENADSLSLYGLDHLSGNQAELIGFLSEDTEGLVGYGKHLLAVHLGMLVIDEVRGVKGLNDQPMGKPTMRDLSALFLEFIPGSAGVSFGGLFLAIAENGAALEISEGNASAVAPNGSSGAAANTVKGAKPADTDAPKGASVRAKKRGKKA